MLKFKEIKTILLGLIVITITFIVYVALPATVPSLSDFSCERIFWGCGRPDIQPVIYYTLIWRFEKPPQEKIHDQNIDYYPNVGRFNITQNSDIDNIYTISGYLHYGRYTEQDEEKNWEMPRFYWVGLLKKKPLTINIQEIYEHSELTRDPITIMTDGNGYFETKLIFNENSVCYKIYITFQEQIIRPVFVGDPVAFYPEHTVFETNCSDSLEIEKKGIPFWVWLLTGIGVFLVGGLLCWYLSRRRKINRGYNEAQQILKAIDKKEDRKAKEEAWSGGNVSQVSIIFSDIEEFLPSIWETGSNLFIEVILKSSSGVNLSLQDFEMDWGDREKVKGTCKKDTRNIHTHIYQQKGIYRISVIFIDNKTNKEVSSWRIIRIVDYREEMVRLFGEMLESLNVADIEIGPDMTPREVERLLIEKLEGVSKESIRKVIDGFEEANYSTHPVNRESYVRMYRAIREIIGK